MLEKEDLINDSLGKAGYYEISLHLHTNSKNNKT